MERETSFGWKYGNPMSSLGRLLELTSPRSRRTVIGRSLRVGTLMVKHLFGKLETVRMSIDIGVIN